MKATEFTARQIKNWQAYERVRAGERFNMFDPRAVRASGLTGEEYDFVMNHFTELKQCDEQHANPPQP